MANERPEFYVTGESYCSIKVFTNQLMDLKAKAPEYSFVGVFNGINLYADDYERAIDLEDYYYQECEDEDEEGY